MRKRSLVEIIRGEETGAGTVGRAVCIAEKIEKEPIVVADGPGFLVNRLLNPYLEESMTLLLEGVSIERIAGAISLSPSPRFVFLRTTMRSCE